MEELEEGGATEWNKPVNEQMCGSCVQVRQVRCVQFFIPVSSSVDLMMVMEVQDQQLLPMEVISTVGV